MRLIDADALLKSYDVAWMVEYDETGCGVRKKAIPARAVEDAPTINAVPVVHARWVHRCRYIATEIWEWFCSACGELPPGPNKCTYELRYCPRCGAKMDGGADG